MSHSTLVDGATVSAHLTDPEWRIIDCRHQLTDPEAGRRAYASGHLPHAFFLHLDDDLSGPRDGRNGRHPLPDPSTLADKLGAIGVHAGVQVVAYDDAGGMVASRLWWLMRWLGHDRVALLDGGLGCWLAEGRPVSVDSPQASPARFLMDLRGGVVTGTEVLAKLGDDRFRLLDARSADRFRGENETIDPVAGHIPGAINRCYRDNLDPAGRFRPAAELRREFLDLLGAASPEQTVMACGSGVSACHNLLAMEIAGLPGARLYAGSWSEWCSDPERPIATGSD